jgi:DNA-binding GntR family transcriptional regulator
MTVKTISYGYEQIAEYYRELIQMGTMRPGTQLPTVRQAAVAWAVSQPTVSRAWAVLKAERLIVVRAGAHGGTFVATPETQQPQEE